MELIWLLRVGRTAVPVATSAMAAMVVWAEFSGFSKGYTEGPGCRTANMGSIVISEPSVEHVLDHLPRIKGDKTETRTKSARKCVRVTSDSWKARRELQPPGNYRDPVHILTKIRHAYENNQRSLNQATIVAHRCHSDAPFLQQV